MEVGEVPAVEPLCRPRQKRGPGRRGRGVPPAERWFPSLLDTPDLVQARLDSRCATVNIARRRAVCLSPEGELQIFGAYWQARSDSEPKAPRAGPQFAGGWRGVYCCRTPSCNFGHRHWLRTQGRPLLHQDQREHTSRK